MRLENLLREKIYAFAQNNTPSDMERKMLDEIFAREKLKKINAAKIIDNNDNYDSYECQSGESKYCVKVTLDPNDQTIKRDAAFLSYENNKTPKFFSSGELKNWGAKYSIQEFLNGQSAAELGKSFLAARKEEFIDSLRLVHKTDSGQSRSFYQYLSDDYILSDFKKLDVDFSIDKEVGEIRVQELSATKELIKSLYSPVLDSKEYLHGQITPSRIILGGELKLINFDHSYHGNPLLDILGLKYEFFLHESVEMELLKLYRQYRQFSNEEYSAAAKIIKVIKFHDLITEFIKQVYVYKGVRARKILELTEKMSRSFGHFAGLEPFEKHKDKIAELFTSSVI